MTRRLHVCLYMPAILLANVAIFDRLISRPKVSTSVSIGLRKFFLAGAKVLQENQVGLTCTQESRMIRVRGVARNLFWGV